MGVSAGSCKRRVKVLAQLIATVLGHGRSGKSASAPEMLAAVMAATLKVHNKKYIYINKYCKVDDRSMKKVLSKKLTNVAVAAFMFLLFLN